MWIDIVSFFATLQPPQLQVYHHMSSTGKFNPDAEALEDQQPAQVVEAPAPAAPSQAEEVRAAAAEAASAAAIAAGDKLNQLVTVLDWNSTNVLIAFFR
jgi:hypothetical protein